MFFNYKNCTFTLSGIDIYASDVNLSIEAKNTAIYREESKKNSYLYAPEDTVDSKFSISYYITGRDSVRDYLLGGSSDTPISGNFCGLYFNSGYITSYSIKGQPDSLIKADVEIQVFEPLKGLFSSSTPSVRPTLYPLNFSNLSISGYFTGQSFDTNTNNFLSFNYNFQREVLKYLKEGDSAFSGNSRAYIGKRNQTFIFEIDNYDSTLPISGVLGSIALNFKSGSFVYDTLNLSGLINSKKTTLQSQGYLKSEFQLKQDFSHFKPVITDFTPRYLYAGGLVTINGLNFINVRNVYFGDAKVPFFSNPSTVLVTATVPTGIKGAVPINIETDESFSSTVFNFKPAVSGGSVLISQFFSGL